MNRATSALVYGLPTVMSAATPYVLGQVAKFIAPIAGYEIANKASKKMGYSGVEDGAVQNVFGNSISDNAKRDIATALAFMPFSISKSAPKVSKAL